VESGVEGSLEGHVALGQTILLYGEGGAVSRSTDGGATFTRVESGVEGNLRGHVETDGAILLYGWDSSLLRVHGARGVAAQGLALGRGAGGDTALRGFIDGLPAHLQATPAVARASIRLNELIASRAVYTGLAEAQRREKDRLDSTAVALLLREEAQIAFADFLDTCRGKAAPAAEGQPAALPDAPLTEHCLTAWTEYRKGSAGVWWQVLVDQVPPGILLLFLLVNLGGLYRYNLRLAGFHESRADALELLARGRDEAQLRDILAASPGDASNLATVFLAADKVEMGKISAKVGNAEMTVERAARDEG
jgi:hypothetical protein